MTKLKEDLMRAMGKMANFEKLNKLIEMTVTPEGLQIELMEDPHGTFFENGSAQPTLTMQNVLKVLSPEAGKLPNPISIEGHTDSKPYSNSGTYDNWELSTDRANEARRLMVKYGLRPDQVVQVRGYADRNLRKPSQPFDASNRRVTVLIQYMPDNPQSIVVTGKGPLPNIK
jgi:chemotaxis protein MotB